jgi:hydrogenase maturation protein HypF
VPLPFESRPILGCGAHLKNTVCLTFRAHAFLSPHIGDLEHYETFAAYCEMIERMKALLRIRPEATAHDLHPDYLSTRYAMLLDAATPRVIVQHHHAHVAACMAEHRLQGCLIGVAFDGAGYGTDGRIWGGEFLVADYTGFTRAAHLAYVPMPGGEKAVREPFRMALAHLRHAFGPWDSSLAPALQATESERRAIALQIEHGLNAPLTSSIGRLFDAIASLAGIRHRARYEGQGAMELEALARPEADRLYPIVIREGEPLVLEAAPIVRAVVDDLIASVPAATISTRFHDTMAHAMAKVCARVRDRTGLRRVVLSGGVFQNAILLGRARQVLAHDGFEVFSHHLVPANDGGISLGQAAVAHARLACGLPTDDAETAPRSDTAQLG